MMFKGAWLSLVYPVLALAGCLWWQARWALLAKGLSLSVILLICLPVLAIGAGLLTALSVHIVEQQFQRAASVVVGLLAWGLLAWLPINSADRLIFEFHRPRYQAELTVPAGTRMKAWLFRDEGGRLGGSCGRNLCCL